SNLTVEIEQGDITSQHVDAMVNAANKYLQHGAGVAGAILSRGGYIIQQESDAWVNLHGVVTHEHPAITGGGLMSCKYVIHAVGPVWGEGDEIQKLEKAIKSSLQAADDLKCQSIALPAISTGVYGFPIEIAAQCFYKVITDLAVSNVLSSVKLIKIILFNNDVNRIFQNPFNKSEITPT
ncbi:MAG TPA: macro domain-containing protein, partial [Leptolinea sp.]